MANLKGLRREMDYIFRSKWKKKKNFKAVDLNSMYLYLIAALTLCLVMLLANAAPPSWTP